MARGVRVGDLQWEGSRAWNSLPPGWDILQRRRHDRFCLVALMFRNCWQHHWMGRCITEALRCPLSGKSSREVAR